MGVADTGTFHHTPFVARDPTFAATPEPPYWAVIFSSRRVDAAVGYEEMAERMAELAAEQPGYLGVETSRAAGGFGITVSYWADADSIAAWKRHVEHVVAQDRGRREWYARYEVRVARVERAYGRNAWTGR